MAKAVRWPLRILMVSNLCPPDFDGGFEMRALQLAQSLRARGHDVQFVTSHYRSRFSGDRQDPPWVHRILEYTEKGESGMQKITRFLAALPRSVENANALETFLAGREFDLAYLFGLHRIGLATHQPIVQRGIPVLWHAGDPFLARQLKVWPRKSPPYNLLLNTVYRKARSMELQGDYRNIAFVSKNLFDYYRASGLEPAHAFIIPRAVDFPLGSDVDRPRLQPPLFFQACRLHAQKGPHVAIRAAALLAERAPDLEWSLEIAGAPEHPNYREELVRLIERSHLATRVRLVGQLPRNKVLERMRGATALIHASIFEDPFANTIVEALGSGTPLLGSDIGSIREVVAPNESTLIFPPGDAEALSHHMETVLRNPEFARHLAAAGIRLVEERYTLDKIMDLTENTFREVLSQSTEAAACA